MRIKLIDFGGKTPVRKHYNDAGADIFSPRDQTIYPPGRYILSRLVLGLNCPTALRVLSFPEAA